VRAYLDIETTGLSRAWCALTVVGIAVEKGEAMEVVQLLEEDLQEAKLAEALAGVDEVYTYNGSRFDLPFIKAKLGVDVKHMAPHRDLMYDCWRVNLKGGLKAVERKLGIERELAGMCGYMAVRLWWDYVNNADAEALAKLLKYNREDVVNLKALRLKLGVE